MTSYLDVMMRLIAQGGVRLDRPLTELDRMILQIQMTPYCQLSQRDRQWLKLLLDLQYQEREAIRIPELRDGQKGEKHDHYST
jgi:hypothetical protein